MLSLERLHDWMRLCVDQSCKVALERLPTWAHMLPWSAQRTFSIYRTSPDILGFATEGPLLTSLSPDKAVSKTSETRNLFIVFLWFKDHVLPGYAVLCRHVKNSIKIICPASSPCRFRMRSPISAQTSKGSLASCAVNVKLEVSLRTRMQCLSTMCVFNCIVFEFDAIVSLHMSSPGHGIWCTKKHDETRPKYSQHGRKGSQRILAGENTEQVESLAQG